MNLHEFDATTRAILRLLARLALACLVIFLIALTSCTVCPNDECPVFPNAAPRQ